MADPVLKFPPEAKGNPADPAKKVAARAGRRLMAGLRRYRRTLLLVVLPIVAVIAGFVFYLSGGRYVSTDNAYIGAQKVLITPDISGKIEQGRGARRPARQRGRRIVRDRSETVPARRRSRRRRKLDRPGPITTISRQHQDSRPDRRARAEERRAQAARRRPQNQAGAELAGSQADVDTATTGAGDRATQAQFRQQKQTAPQSAARQSRPAARAIPGLQQAKAALEQAQRDLDHTMLRAPIAGIATQVDNIQLGRFVPAGTPVF